MSTFITLDDLKVAILDLAARRRYRIMYEQVWENGSETGHDEAREATTAEDVAVVAAVLWSHDRPLSADVFGSVQSSLSEQPVDVPGSKNGATDG